jgi:hypothetical protein
MPGEAESGHGRRCSRGSVISNRAICGQVPPRLRARGSRGIAQPDGSTINHSMDPWRRPACQFRGDGFPTSPEDDCAPRPPRSHRKRTGAG